MSIEFRWFKGYEIIGCQDYHDIVYAVSYIGGGSTSHSAGNVIRVQNLLEKYTGKCIPTINENWIQSELDELDLIDPDEMSKMCTAVLDGETGDMDEMRERFEWFKKLSDEGFYLSYDACY